MLLLYFDQFLQRTWWVKQLVILLITTLLFIFGCFLLLIPVQQQRAYEIANYQLSINEIDLVTQKIALMSEYLSQQQQIDAQDSTKPKLILTPLFSRDCLRITASLLAKSHLKLINLTTTKQAAMTKWQFSLQGNYQQLVSFFEQLAEQHYRIELCGISINRNEENLIFSICLLTENSPNISER